MNHITSIGLDVHARSVTAVAIDSITGETVCKRFEYSPAEIASWIQSFDRPRAVYESGVTGFHLVRALRELGVDCVVGAVSKMARPSADKKAKNDRNDAKFLARQLMAHNIVEVFVPDTEAEGARNLFRVYEDAKEDLTRAKHRLTHFLIRWGYVWNECNENGKRQTAWTKAFWKWVHSIDLCDTCAQDVLELYAQEVIHAQQRKEDIVKMIEATAQNPRWRTCVESLRCLKGIDTITAFALVVETTNFSRFRSARAFSSWLGLVPSEHSSGEKVSRGGITKAGNSHLRKLLVEASWHYTHATCQPKRKTKDDNVPKDILVHATKATKRLVRRRRHLTKNLLKRSVVANVATARELACWIWAIGCMSEEA